MWGGGGKHSNEQQIYEHGNIFMFRKIFLFPPLDIFTELYASLFHGKLIQYFCYVPSWHDEKENKGTIVISRTKLFTNSGEVVIAFCVPALFVSKAFLSLNSRLVSKQRKVVYQKNDL